MGPGYQARASLPGWLLKPALLLGLAGYCVLLGALLGAGRERLAVLLLAPVALLVSLHLAFVRFQLLALALPLTALTLPQLELPTGTETKLPVSLLLALLLTGVMVLAVLLKGWRLAPSPLNRPLLAFGAVCVVSFGWGLAWRDPGLISAPTFIITQLGSLATILVSLSAALLVGNFFDTPGKLAYLVGLFLTLGTLMTMSQLARLHHPLLNDRGLWSTWLLACAYGLLIAQPGLRLRWRVALAAVILLTLYQVLIVNSFWVSGWAPGLLALAAITFLRSRKAFVPVMLLGLAGLYLARAFFFGVAQENIDEGGLERMIIYQQSWRVLREHPLLGTGPAGYALYYMTYFPQEARSTHNNFLDIVSQFGLVGLAVWLWLMGASLYEGWRLSRQAAPGLLRTVAMIATGGWAAALGSMMLGDWVLPFAYNQGIAGYKYTVYSWLFLGLLISLRQCSQASLVK